MKLDLKSVLPALDKIKGLILAVLVAGVLVYTGYVMKDLTTVEPDENYLKDQISKNASAVPKLDVKAIESTKDLINVPVSPNLSNLGKNDPFAP